MDWNKSVAGIELDHLNVGRVDCINDFLKIDLASMQWHHLYTDSLVVQNVKGMEYNLPDFFLSLNSFIPLAVKSACYIFERSIRNKHLSVNDSPLKLWEVQVSNVGNRIRVLTEPSSLLTDSSTKASDKLLAEVKCGSCAIKLLFYIIVRTTQTGILFLLFFNLLSKHWRNKLQSRFFIVFCTGVAIRKQCNIIHTYLPLACSRRACALSISVPASTGMLFDINSLSHFAV